MCAQLVMRLAGPLDQLRLVWQAGETLLESVAFEEDAEGTRYHVLLALQEMVTNVLRHAYELDESKPLEVEFRVENNAFCVELRDQGPPFDPLGHDMAADDFGKQMPTEAGGYGIHIAKMVMDDLHYERSNGWNILRMRKSVHASAPSTTR